MPTSSDVLVVGGGVIGLAVAWRCAQQGLDVTVIDPAPGSGATWTAAGMLAPATEVHPTERPLVHLNVASARRYPAFAQELEAVTGLPVGLRRTGTLAVAWDAGDLAALREQAALQNELGLRSELVGSRALREQEPGLAPGLAGGLLASDDHSVDNRLLHTALRAAVAAAGGRVVAARVGAVDVRADRAVGVRLEDGGRLGAPTVVLAAGTWSSGIGGLAGVVPRVRPVKGQTVRLRTTGEPPLRRVLRGSVRGAAVYVVPRGDGRLVVGATSEEAGFDLRPRAGAVYELLRDATALLPALAEAEFEEVSTGLRPATPDNAPLLGPSRLPGLLLACGHYRNGVLLAPVTADGIAALVTGAAPVPELAGFGPQRFDRVAVGSRA